MRCIKILKDGVFFAFVADEKAADRLVYAYRNTYVFNGEWTYVPTLIAVAE